MTQDKIIHMAREAFEVEVVDALIDTQKLVRFATIVFEAGCTYEREACAKVCEEGTGEAVQKTTLEILLNERKRIAKAIRDRGDE